MIFHSIKLPNAHLWEWSTIMVAHVCISRNSLLLFSSKDRTSSTPIKSLYLVTKRYKTSSLNALGPPPCSLGSPTVVEANCGTQGYSSSSTEKTEARRISLECLWKLEGPWRNCQISICRKVRMKLLETSKKGDSCFVMAECLTHLSPAIMWNA